MRLTAASWVWRSERALIWCCNTVSWELDESIAIEKEGDTSKLQFKARSAHTCAVGRSSIPVRPHSSPNQASPLLLLLPNQHEHHRRVPRDRHPYAVFFVQLGQSRDQPIAAAEFECRRQAGLR